MFMFLLDQAWPGPKEVEEQLRVNNVFLPAVQCAVSDTMQNGFSPSPSDT